MKIDPKLLTGGTATVTGTTGVNAARLLTDTTTRSSALPAGETGCLSEAAWHDLVVSSAMGHGWEVAHCRKVLCKMGERTWWETTMPEGWPDLFLVRGPVSLFVELKTDTGRIRPAQKKWRQLLEAAGHDFRVWRPRDRAAVRSFLSRPE